MLLVLASPVLAGACALFVGAYGIAPTKVFDLLFHGRGVPEAAIVWDIRLPRILLAAIVGAALAGSGATLQAVFRNPLVDPFLLGISAGAALGCALGIGFLPQIPLPLLAFVFGAVAVVLSWGVAGQTHGDTRLTLVLAGVVISALFTALVSLIKVVLDPQRLQSIVFWLMGSFSLADWHHVAVALGGAVVGLGPVMFLRWRLNLLTLGDREAESLGVDVRRLRLVLVAGTTLAAATAVSVCGIVGWVGLMVPHLIRLGFGPDNRRLFPLSLAGGATFLVVADTMARSIASWEVPVGVVTALMGAPFFMLLMRRRAGWAP
ncbi:MAG: iron ABC transporter permease [Phyllobacteriaceae bacterium]|nr:iron ABC transporter permease [Phyllobacteriaceae bacterium]